ncbi:Hpt domain-containing protein [Vibrio natriegens]|uniref:quorum-sensing phosphorelay protein LuxU n=1 Tax=Vibrio natriegens TaxID=691 RepID=UPI00159425D4|nr:quorum-sensing phosphorelay protein LuxU [Vibrio natriegens]NVC96161.1 Hpt domain-containing protein [Vibrio natriegens]
MSMNILNQKKIENLSMEIGSDNVPVLLDIFLGEIDTYIQNLSLYDGTEQLTYLKEISHALKSSAASFGADRLCDLAISIDKKAKAGELVVEGEEATTMIDVLRDTQEVYRSWSL